MVKHWKENPPGDEQKLLEALFDEGAIEDDDTASTVQARKPEFKAFSERVFASHFNKTKARYGIYAKPSTSKATDIVELGGHGSGASSGTTVETRKRPSSHEANELQFKNAPYIVWVYADHDRQCEIVCVAIPIISGARDVDFFLSEDNITLNVNYVWPAAMTSPTELFRKQLNSENRWTMSHPKIHSFMTRLHEMGLSARTLPPASIVIKLPKKVQRESHTYSFAGVKTNDGNVVMLEFQAFQKLHVIAEVDTKIKFD